MMELTYFDVIELMGELKSLKSRIAELEKSNDVLRKDNDMLFRAVIAASNQSRRNTQTQTIVYGKDVSRSVK